MYIVSNKTKNTLTKYESNFPLIELEKCLNNGDKLIVISYYSNTIKVPYSIMYENRNNQKKTCIQGYKITKVINGGYVAEKGQVRYTAETLNGLFNIILSCCNSYRQMGQ